MFPPPRCCCSQAAQPARPNSSRADMPTIAINFSASAELCGISQQSVYLAVLRWRITFRWPAPVFWERLACGGKVVLTDSASCDEVMPLIAQERVTHVALVPALAQLWVQAREWGRQRPFVAARHSGRRRPASTRRLLSRLSPPLTVPCNRFSVWRKACSVLPGWTIRMPPFSTARGARCPLWMKSASLIKTRTTSRRAKPGQLLTRGPYTISGYYRAPAHNAQAFTAQGFYRTGDNVRLDEVGNLHVEGRIKEQNQPRREKK
ncbi:yersiniabactin siderophore biosynthetic protein [Escherichia coli]|nr:yersiniabactin siderophore biosynthetic protein [Escherichia coli]